MGGRFAGIRTPEHNAPGGTPLTEPFPHDDPEEQAEFLRNRLFDRLAACREEGPIAAEDLRQLLGLLDGTDRPSRRASVIAEIGVAERLLALGADLRVEVPNPEGRSADLEVELDSTRFFLHLKRLPDPKPNESPQHALPKQLEGLEELPRPYRVGVRIREGLTKDELESVEVALREFLLGARMGDRRVIRDTTDEELAAAVVIAPSETGHVELTGGAIDRAAPLIDRAHRLLRRAYQQFVPGAENIILLIGGGVHGGEVMDLALLGVHEERWDRLPRRHQRIAHGRAADGLWSGKHFERSNIAAWLEDPFADGRLWIREQDTCDGAVVQALKRLLEHRE